MSGTNEGEREELRLGGTEKKLLKRVLVGCFRLTVGGVFSHLALLQACVSSEDSENIWTSVQFQSASG